VDTTTRTLDPPIKNRKVWEFASPRARSAKTESGKLGNLPALETEDRGIKARLPDPFSCPLRSKAKERRQQR